MATMTKPRPTTQVATSTPATAPVDTRPEAQVLAVDIAGLLEQLRPLANQVHALVDTYQPTLTLFTGPETAQALANAIREERRGRIDTTTRPVGLQWMRGTTGDKPLGTHAEAGRGQAVSAAANITFTLTDVTGRLQASVDRAGVGIRILPRLPQDPSLGHLAGHLVALVHHAARALPPAIAIPKLRNLAREIQWIVNEADVAIDGTGQTTHGDCPHCGRPTIVIDFKTGVIRCDTDRRTRQLEECRCGDDYCLCRYKPIEFRHEWRKSKVLHADGWKSFSRLRNRPKKPSFPDAKHATPTSSTTSTTDPAPSSNQENP